MLEFRHFIIISGERNEFEYTFALRISQNNGPEESACDCIENLTFLNARIPKEFLKTIGHDREEIMDHFQNPDIFG